MPLADLTAIANLALSHLGEPFLTDVETDEGTTAEAVRLHLDQCLETVLEGHVWSFATRSVVLSPLERFATLTLDPTGADNAVTFTAVSAGAEGNDLTIRYVIGAGADTTATVDGDAITITLAALDALTITGPTDPEDFGSPVLLPAGTLNGFDSWSVAGELNLFHFTNDWVISRIDSTYYAFVESAATSPVGLTGWTITTGAGQPVIAEAIATALDVIAAVEASPEVAALVTASLPEDTTGLGTIGVAIAATALTGGIASPAGQEWPGEYTLPADCLRLLKIDGHDIDAPRNRFEIQGRYLLIPYEEEDGPRIHYITSSPPVEQWPTTFTDAVAFLLASRLAPVLTQDQNLANAFLAKHEQALGKARSKDTRETRSKENHGPRALAARSGLVNARYSIRGTPFGGHRIIQPAAPSDEVSDWSGEIT